MGISTENRAGALRPAAAAPPAGATEHTPAPAEDAPHAPHPTAEPLVTIQPSNSWLAFRFRDLWEYRELLYFLMWRDVKVRYKQTALGVLWAVLQPLFMMLLFSFIFGRLAGIKSDDIPYPLFAYAGLLPWTFFSNALTASGNSLVGSANLITKVYFPRVLVPAAAVGAGLVDFAISFAVLAALMAFYRVEPGWNLLMLPALVALTTLLALGFGMWMSALNVKYRDIRHALPFLIQVWFFASPIVYQTETLMTGGWERWRWVLALNPMTGIIEGYRAALYGHRGFDWALLGTSAAITLVVLLYAAFTFQRMEKTFADIV